MEASKVHAPGIPSRPAPGGWAKRLRFERLGRRRGADRLLRVSGGQWEAHPAVAWRVAELTSPRERRALARSLRGIVSDVRSRRPVISAVPLNRRGLRAHVAELSDLADRLADLDRPVRAAGIVLLRDLLTDGGSPLYTGGRVADLPAVLEEIRDLLGGA